MCALIIKAVVERLANVNTEGVLKSFESLFLTLQVPWALFELGKMVGKTSVDGILDALPSGIVEETKQKSTLDENTLCAKTVDFFYAIKQLGIADASGRDAAWHLRTVTIMGNGELKKFEDKVRDTLRPKVVTLTALLDEEFTRRHMKSSTDFQQLEGEFGEFVFLPNFGESDVEKLRPLAMHGMDKNFLALFMMLLDVHEERRKSAQANFFKLFGEMQGLSAYALFDFFSLGGTTGSTRRIMGTVRALKNCFTLAEKYKELKDIVVGEGSPAADQKVAARAYLSEQVLVPIIGSAMGDIKRHLTTVADLIPANAETYITTMNLPALVSEVTGKEGFGMGGGHHVHQCGVNVRVRDDELVLRCDTSMSRGECSSISEQETRL